MQSDASSPAQYLEQLDDDWRKATLVSLRSLILEHAPDWEEGMAYKMLGYRDAGEVVMCLNAQKQYVSLYVGNAAKIDHDGSLLAGLDIGKGCIRFKRSVAVADTGIEQFIQRAVAMRRDGAEFGC